MTDIPAADLARELNLPVAELLARADRVIEKIVMRDGVLAASGYTTRIRQHGMRSEVSVSPQLANALRADAGKP